MAAVVVVPHVCPLDSVRLANHQAVRDCLRANPDAAQEYGALRAAGVS